MEVEVVISHTLIMPVLLDIPELLNHNCMIALTRAQKKQQQLRRLRSMKEQESDIQPKTQESDEVSDIINPFSFFWLDTKIFEPSKVKKRLTKKQKKESDHCFQEKSLRDLEKFPLLLYEKYNSKIVVEERVAHKADPSGVDKEKSNIVQVVLLLKFRPTILKLTRHIHLARHLWCDKTT